MSDACERFDVLVVGAGPAGSSLALRLARAGRRTALLDARSFPRSKPCGDAVSPGATPLLQELGVWDEVRRRAGGGVLLEGWRIRAHGGGWIDARFGQNHEGPPPHGLAVDRRTLDATLLDAAREAGVRVFERRRVFALDRPAVARRTEPGELEVVAREPDGRVERYRTRFVVGADGLRSRVARWLGPVRRGDRPRLALVARYRGVPPTSPWGELRLSDEGVLGYAPTSRTSCNVTLVVPAAAARETRPDPAAFLADRIRRYGARSLVGGGRPDRRTEVTGPFELTPARRSTCGVLLVGDAAGYFDPFTGQGVFRALLGARLAAEAIERCLDEPDHAGGALADYEARLDAHLHPARRLQRLIDGVVSRGRLMNPTAGVLRHRAGLAARLVDATGDRLPPDEILRPITWLGALLDRESATRAPREVDAHA